MKKEYYYYVLVIKYNKKMIRITILNIKYFICLEYLSINH